MTSISNALFWISNGLLVPVVVLLLLFFVRALLAAGGFFGEFYRNRKLQERLSECLNGLDTRDTPGWIAFKYAAIPKDDRIPVLVCLHDLYAHRYNEAYCERLMANFEVDAEKKLGHSRIFVKLGPMLGLMGTLIPMGPALVGLSTGDIASMAYNMQVAFATTVVGMVIAAIGVVTLQANQRWCARNLNDLEYFYKIVSAFGTETKTGTGEAGAAAEREAGPDCALPAGVKEGASGDPVSEGEKRGGAGL